MEFMGYHIVDIVIVGLVAFLAIKGLVNGFTKEFLNFITIVGGVILAARYDTQVIQLINEQDLIPPISDDFSKIIGFILIIVSVWLLVGFISSIITKLTTRPSGFLSRLLGYILSAVRYAFIFSLIIFGVSQSEFFAKSATKFKDETQLFQPMTELGAKILNRDIEEIHSTENNITEINLTITPSATLVEDNSSY